MVHSLGRGTGSEVGIRLLEMLNDNYPKMELFSCPVFGFYVEKTTLSQFNTKIKSHFSKKEFNFSKPFILIFVSFLNSLNVKL